MSLLFINVQKKIFESSLKKTVNQNYGTKV